MRKFSASVIKEYYVLRRDKAGLLLLFLMPSVLIVVMSLLQEVGFDAIRKDKKVEVLFLDNDHDSLGARIREGLTATGFFHLVDSTSGQLLTSARIREMVTGGEYIIGIVIPEGLTKKLRNNVRQSVGEMFAGFGLYPQGVFKQKKFPTSDTVLVYFDPTIKNSFRYSIISTIRQYSSQIQSEMLFSIFHSEMKSLFPNYLPPATTYREAVAFREIFPTYGDEDIVPDTAQHNVPAWTIFAMFFIIIPLTSSMIVDRETGTLNRLMTMPVTYIEVMMAKVFVYVLVCFLQAFLMILCGVYLLPLFGLAALTITGNISLLILLTLVIALAALGFGILIGTVAKTHQQAAAFGSVAVVIMAAVGGLWVPTYLMSPAMQQVAALSPLNWALNGYYHIFVRGGGLNEVAGQLLLLFSFFLLNVFITIVYWKITNPLNK